MVKASELVVKGTASQHAPTAPVVYCYKTRETDINGNGTKGVYIPCKYNTIPREYKHAPFTDKPFSLRPEQEKVITEIEAVIQQQLDEGKVSAVAFGHIYTGFGKTRLMVEFIRRRKLPALVIVNSDAIRKGWLNTFKEAGIDVHEATGSELGQYDVCVLSIQLAVRHKFGRDAYSHYGTVICDEADVLCTQLSVNELLDMSPRYFIGLTATVRRNDGLDKVLNIFWGDRKHWVIRLKEFGEECSMDLHILYTPFIVDDMYNKNGDLDWSGMALMAANIDERNLLIRNLCLMHHKSKILILCKRKEHVQILKSLMRNTGMDVSTYYESNKSYYDAHILIATLSKAGRGYDDAQVSAAFDGRRFDVLILAMTMKNADQALGRGLRDKYLRCYLVVDENHVMKNHAQKMKDENAKRGARIIEEYV